MAENQPKMPGVIQVAGWILGEEERLTVAVPTVDSGDHNSVWSISPLKMYPHPETHSPWPSRSGAEHSAREITRKKTCRATDGLPLPCPWKVDLDSPLVLMTVPLWQNRPNYLELDCVSGVICVRILSGTPWLLLLEGSRRLAAVPSKLFSGLVML